MKAISLWQPFATLVATSEKRIETRGRSTTIRGEIAIHGTKTMPAEAHRACHDLHIHRALVRNGFLSGDGSYNLPRGAIVAVATLIDVVPMPLVWQSGEWTIERQGYRWVLTEQERAFGHYGPGRFAWLLTDIRRLPHPVPCRGYQVIGWQVPFDVEAQVRRQL